MRVLVGGVIVRFVVIRDLAALLLLFGSSNIQFAPHELID